MNRVFQVRSHRIANDQIDPNNKRRPNGARPRTEDDDDDYEYDDDYDYDYDDDDGEDVDDDVDAIISPFRQRDDEH